MVVNQQGLIYNSQPDSFSGDSFSGDSFFMKTSDIQTRIFTNSITFWGVKP
jgi:hypothetical protein